jgi:1-deoxy-D-xylulose-5-phosphate reductoisomerase
MRSVTILGASGSIGRTALAFLRNHRDKFLLRNVAFGKDWQAALDISREFNVASVSFEDTAAARSFMASRAYVGARTGSGPRVVAGPQSAVEMAADCVDVVLAAISGSAGLPSVISAIRSGNRVALANKESLVCAGPELLALAARHGTSIIPVDSEHSAIFQSLLAGKKSEVNSLLLTASGGPFRDAPLAEMANASPEKALAHPNWSMGHKNSIDSATLANKGLEMIEAAYLFDRGEEDIEVVINPSSVLHSAVCFCDGSMIAQLGHPDMRMAVGYGISWPDRMPSGVKRLSLADMGSLHFSPVDHARFPCLGLARSALRAGGDGPLLFNAANEVGVASFLRREIRLIDIAPLVDHCLDKGMGRFRGPLDEVSDLHEEAVRFCRAEANRLELRPAVST